MTETGGKLGDDDLIAATKVMSVWRERAEAAEAALIRMEREAREAELLAINRIDRLEAHISRIGGALGGDFDDDPEDLAKVRMTESKQFEADAEKAETALASKDAEIERLRVSHEEFIRLARQMADVWAAFGHERYVDTAGKTAAQLVTDLKDRAEQAETRVKLLSGERRRAEKAEAERDAAARKMELLRDKQYASVYLQERIDVAEQQAALAEREACAAYVANWLERNTVRGTKQELRQVLSLLPGDIRARTEDNNRWQPIDTAPKDGTRIALLIPYDREKFSEADCTTIGYWNGECFRYHGDDGVDDIQPTHWRPPPRISAAVLAERKAIEEIVMHYGDSDWNTDIHNEPPAVALGIETTCRAILAAIRARTEKETTYA